jgi:hypothetical protein
MWRRVSRSLAVPLADNHSANNRVVDDSLLGVKRSPIPLDGRGARSDGLLQLVSLPSIAISERVGMSRNLVGAHILEVHLEVAPAHCTRNGEGEWAGEWESIRERVGATQRWETRAGGVACTQ